MYLPLSFVVYIILIYVKKLNMLQYVLRTITQQKLQV